MCWSSPCTQVGLCVKDNSSAGGFSVRLTRGGCGRDGHGCRTGGCQAVPPRGPRRPPRRRAGACHRPDRCRGHLWQPALGRRRQVPRHAHARRRCQVRHRCWRSRGVHGPWLTWCGGRNRDGGRMRAWQDCCAGDHRGSGHRPVLAGVHRAAARHVQGGWRSSLTARRRTHRRPAVSSKPRATLLTRWFGGQLAVELLGAGTSHEAVAGSPATITVTGTAANRRAPLQRCVWRLN